MTYSIIIIPLNLDCILACDAEPKADLLTFRESKVIAWVHMHHNIYREVEIGAHLSEFLVNSGK